MAGEPYAAGGIRTTVRATRAATDEQLTAHVGHLVREMQRQGTTTVEIKSGYGLTTLDEVRSLAVARQFTEETTFLRSEEHTSELQSLMRISYAVFCLKKKKVRQHSAAF